MRKKKKKVKGEETLLKIENFIEKQEPIKANDKTYEKIIFIYSVAIKELLTKLEILKDEFKIFYDYDIIDHIQTRIKKPESIIKKMQDKGYELTYQMMIENINDIAGIRVICPLKKDIFSVRNLVEKLTGIRLLKEKDYVTNPKKSGYSSYHLIVEVPVTLSQRIIYVKVEIQIRTMAMDFWASLEHKMKYKAKGTITKKTSKELIEYAKIITKLDNKMMLLNKEV